MLCSPGWISINVKRDSPQAISLSTLQVAPELVILPLPIMLPPLESLLPEASTKETVSAYAERDICELEY